MKRRDDNRQLRPEEVEALESEEAEEAGTFARASAEVLAQRKRIKIKRKSESNGPSFTTNAPSNNPFANFSGMTGSASAPAAAPAASPFLGFSGLSNPSSATNGGSPLGTKNSEPTMDKPKSNQADSMTKVTPEMEKMQRLNKSFLDWMNRQRLQHGLSIWKDGLQDYINYADSIQKGTSNNGNASGAAGTAEVKLPAFPALSSSFSFQPKPSADSTTTVATKEDSKPAASSNFSTGFSFSTTKPAEEPKKATEAAAPALGSAGFGFGAKKTNEPSAPAPAPTSTGFPSFSFNKPAETSKPAAAFPAFNFNKPEGAAAPVQSAGNDDDDEGEPILEPEVVHRNENDNDDILHEVDCKLFRFDKEQNEWKDAGKGKFRVTKAKDSDKKRILLRNLTGKIMMNVFFYKKMTFTKLGKNGIRFMHSTDGSGEMKMLMIKTKQENVDSTVSFLQSCVPE